MSKTFKYGGDNTIHKNNSVDVVVDKHGKVVAVWFRCMMLPFRQSDDVVGGEILDNKDLHGIDAIDFINKKADQ